MSRLHRILPFLTLAIAIAAMYLYDLNGVGVLQTDEPRYLAIGHAMARTGDWTTPKLWGQPWFEKPALLYWMTGLGSLLGLGPELAGRLPVALLSLAFLWVAWELLSGEFGQLAAGTAVALLATSAGWLAYSELALTDLPMAAFFSLALFLSLPLLRREPDTHRLNARLLIIGACLGFAILAKGLVPVVLGAPFLWFLRGYWRKWWLPGASATVFALPWYAAVTAVNGYSFIQDFFLKHHFQRLYSSSLQHVQPWYYYGPVLLAALFPWTPLFFFLLKRGLVWDARRRFLAAVVAFGFVFFTISLNKLPGYLLPILPAAFALLASHLEFRQLTQTSRWWLAPSACLIGLAPMLVTVLPSSLSSGRVSLAAMHLDRTALFYVLLPIAALILARRSWSGPILVLCVVLAGLYLKVRSFPILDEMASPRQLWTEIQQESPGLCDAGTNREWLYGLEFYRGSAIPPCAAGKGFREQLRSTGRGRPALAPFAQ